MQRDELTQLLVAELGGESIDSVTCHLEGPVFNGPNSIVYRGTGTLFPGPVAIKLCRWPGASKVDAARTDARLQHSALVRMRDAMGADSALTVPIPVALIERHGVLVTQWVDGQTLDALCRDWHRPVETIHEGVARAGSWLRRFHDSHPLEPGPVEVAHMMELMQRAIGADAGPRSGFAARALRVAHDAIDSIEGVTVPRSWLHGDFKPGNLIVSSDLTVAMDGGAYFEKMVLLDIAHFLNNLELLLCHPRALRLMPHRARLIAAFGAAYGLGDRIPFRPLLWVRLASAIRMWIDLAPRFSGPLARIYNNCAFTLLIRGLVREVTVSREAGSEQEPFA